MSDGCLTMHKQCVNASFHMNNSMRNEDLAHYVIPYLEAIGVGYTYRPGEKYFSLRSKTHPFLTTLYQRVYEQGRKVPSHHDFKLLDWEAVAILYMCDGSIQQTGKYKQAYPVLNLCRWSYAELCWVKAQFKDRLGFDANVWSCGKYWRLGVPKKDAGVFFENVRPYMLPSFSYKLPNDEPLLEKEGDEIVRPVGKPAETGGNDLSIVTM